MAITGCSGACCRKGYHLSTIKGDLRSTLIVWPRHLHMTLSTLMKQILVVCGCCHWFASSFCALSGVDLSAGMIAKAAERRLYSSLSVSDLVEYLCRQRRQALMEGGGPAANQGAQVRVPDSTSGDCEGIGQEAVVASAASISAEGAGGCFGAAPTRRSSDGSGPVLAYDLMVAADVFVYIGDLQVVLTAAARCACPG
jgi:hypothetical protein